jgi:hypothetical protein
MPEYRVVGLLNDRGRQHRRGNAANCAEIAARP